MRSVKSKARKPAPVKSRRSELTADDLERLIAERAGVLPVQVVVRGSAPDWTASLIAKRLGNAERHAQFSSLANELRGKYDLKG